MKNTKELQEEFELLIEELGRLKSINEITFENSNNSKRTIDSIESLVSAMDAFKKRVESDYELKSDELIKLQNSFKDVIGSLESNVDQQMARFESIVHKYTESSNKSKEEFQKKTNQTLNNFTDLSISAFDKQQLSIEKSVDLISDELLKMREAIDNSNSTYRQIHEDSSKELSERLNLINSRLSTVDLINDELSKMREAIDNSNSTYRQIHEDSSKEMREQLILITSRLNVVQKKHRVLSTLLIVTMVLVAASIGISFYFLT